MHATAIKKCITKVDRYCLLLGALSVLVSCQNNQRSTQKDTKEQGQKVSLKDEFLPVIQGVWIKKDYIDKIARTKSPAAAAELASGITVLYFDKKKMAGDSLLADVVWNNHEGSNAVLHFAPGKRPHTLLLSEYPGGYSVSDLGYQVTGGDTILIKYHTDKGKTTTVNYVKALAHQPQDKMDVGINHLINSRVVAGNYFLTNAQGKQSRVVFTRDGTVTGLERFSTYYIKNDVGGEPLNNLDAIMFDMALKSKRKDFTYKIKGDTLTLYTTYPNNDFTESVIGKPVYKLIRQR